MKQDLISRAAALIMSKNRFLIATHVNPDGDAIGSSLALGEILRNMGKDVVCYCETPVSDRYLFMPGAYQFTAELADPEQREVFVVIDCSDLDRAGKVLKKSRMPEAMINIDHHRNNQISGGVHLVDENACASAELVYRLIGELRQPITRSAALNLYTAILTDTGSFRFSNTNQAAFRISEEMVGLGVIPQVVARKVYGTYSAARLKLLSHVLDTLEISPNKMFATVSVTLATMARTGTIRDDINGFVDYPRFITGIEFSALVQEISEGRFHVSLRSAGNVNVAKIAEEFGGGGHFNASGFEAAGDIDSIKSRLTRIADSVERQGSGVGGTQ